VLDWAHSDKLLDTVLLGQLGGSLDEAILVRGARKVIVSKVYDILGTLQTKVKVSSCLGLILLDLYSRRQGSLPGIH
jgi:hypothetical protein